MRMHFEGQLHLFDPEDAVSRYLNGRIVVEVSRCVEPIGPQEISSETQNSVEGLMRVMEMKSLEPQRYCPEDWNQYLALITRCFVQQAPRPRERQFKV